MTESDKEFIRRVAPMMAQGLISNDEFLAAVVGHVDKNFNEDDGNDYAMIAIAKYSTQCTQVLLDEIKRREGEEDT